ncbi:DNA replication/repair protein RecF [Candidatus Latescibacterota bacterium]
MRIRQLSLLPYRNFGKLDLPLGDGDVLILGGNGRGKSNILEAISYLSIGKSIRGARDQEAVPHGGEYFDVRAQWHDGQRDRQLRAYYSNSEGKRIFLDGTPLTRISDVLSLFQTVHFSPEDVALVLQFSGQRRRLLDILISQSSAVYLQDLQRYQRVLTQRNQYLRSWTGGGADDLAAWDVQLARLGAAIRGQRRACLVQLRPAFIEYYECFSTGREEAGLTYRDQPVEAADEGMLPSGQELEEELIEELAQGRESERRAGFTLCGPHRDAFAFTLDAEAADTYGSQGQLKSILLSWKMAELRFLEDRSGQQPVLLLDDALSELDPERSVQLLSLAQDFEQVILTSPRRPSEELGPAMTQIDLDA